MLALRSLIIYEILGKLSNAFISVQLAQLLCINYMQKIHVVHQPIYSTCVICMYQQLLASWQGAHQHSLQVFSAHV